MINNQGQWEENKDYSTFPQNLWCDMDFMAVWIRNKGYEPKTSMESLIENILFYYNDETSEATLHEDGSCTYYYAVPDERPHPENLMIHIPDVEAYVEDSGGLARFDFWA